MCAIAGWSMLPSGRIAPKASCHGAAGRVREPPFRRLSPRSKRSQSRAEAGLKLAKWLKRTAAKPCCAWPVLSRERLLCMPAIAIDEFWRQRAAEMRAIADGLVVLPRAKASVLQFADEYDRLAERAKRSMPELG